MNSNKSILLFPFSAEDEKALETAAAITCKLMSRFRKKISFESVSAEIVSELGKNDRAEEIVRKAVKRCCVIIKSGCAETNRNKVFGAGIFTREYIIGEKRVIMPACINDFVIADGSVTKTTVITEESLKRTCRYTFEKACLKNVYPVICTGGDNNYCERFILREAEAMTHPYVTGEISAFTPLSFMRANGGNGKVVLADEKGGNAAINFLCAKQSHNDCLLCEIGESLKAYSPSGEKRGNELLAELLFCMAEALGNEADFKNEAEHLKRAVSIAQELYLDESETSFVSNVVCLINGKIRNRGAVKNDYTAEGFYT